MTRQFFVTVFLLSVVAPATGLRADTIPQVAQFDPFEGGGRYGDVWGEGNVALLGSFQGSGVAIIDISNPASPFLASHYNPAGGGQFKDVKSQNGIGFFASDNGGGVHVVDLANPAAPNLLSLITPNNGGFSSIHNISVAGDYLYEADGRTPVVKVFDISNPSAPTFVRDIQTTDPNLIHDITAIGGRLYTSGFGSKTDIYDVTCIGTQEPALLGSINSGGNSHSSWATSDGNVLASARETNNGDVRLIEGHKKILRVDCPFYYW